jgi:prepilin-type N-terminal cleavage/methylation domain-containing protein
MARISTRAFTLLEVSIVIALVALIVTLALPLTIKARTRAKVAKAITGMREISIALEAYKSENEAYPHSRIAPRGAYRFQHLLTTPTAYIDSVPIDPFRDAPLRSSRGRSYARRTFDYGATPLTTATRWALASYGPDRQDSTYPFFFYPGYSPDLFAGQLEGYNYMLYDPTNGTISRGDIILASDFELPE